MKKRMSKILLLITAIVMVFSFTACNATTVNNDKNEAYELWKSEGNEGSESDFLEWIKEKSEPSPFVSSSIFDSAVFAPKTVVYDGLEHKVSVTGAPEGTEIVYANHSAVEVGVYRAFAYLENNGETKILTTVLTIEKAEITEYRFEDTSVTYDGGMHTLTVGDLPDGVTAEYFCGDVPFDGAVDAGEYVITAELSGALYKPLTVTAKLTIEKADADIQFSGKTAEYNIEQTHMVAVTGTIPKGVSVTYKDVAGNAFESAKIPGEYEVTAVISGGKNYKDAELKATLTITKADLSKKISFNNATFLHDGAKKMIYITGELPPDASVRYTHSIGGGEFDGRTDIGYTYVTATVYGEYYKEFELDARINVVGDRLAVPSNIVLAGANSLTWDKDIKAGSYEVAVYDASDKFIFSANSADDTVNFVSVTHCKVETLLKRRYLYSGDYIIRVRAIPSAVNANSLAESEYSAPLDYTFSAGKLYAPENVRIEGGVLRWNAVPGASFYDIKVEFLDDSGIVIKSRTVGGDSAAYITIDEIVAFVKYGPGNYRFAVCASPASYSSGGVPGKDSFRTSDYSGFTDVVTVNAE